MTFEVRPGRDGWTFAEEVVAADRGNEFGMSGTRTMATSRKSWSRAVAQNTEPNFLGIIQETSRRSAGLTPAACAGSGPAASWPRRSPAPLPRASHPA